MALAEAPSPSPAAPAARPSAAAGEPVAIVGMAVHLPGAPDLATYWRNLVEGVDATSEVPADRWDPVFYDPDSDRADRFYCRRGGFVATSTFDAAAFGVMPVAVDDAEPDQLLALQVAQAAIDDSGVLATAAPERVGVVVGRGGYLTAGLARLDQRVRVANQVEAVLRAVLPDLDAEEVAAVGDAFRRQLGEERPEAAIGLVPNLAASRIANRLDLRGPAFTVDGACASSLLAVQQSIDALRSGRCDVMVAGGVHHCHDVTFWSVFSQLGALSRSERIRPFDRAADGLLIGEGTGMVVLKRLADAERDGDRVYAVVRGVGSSSDGRASSLMKPRVSGQVLALERAWDDAGRDPSAIGLVEAHGTATPAGDTAELETLASFFGPADPDAPRAGLGSVKSMIGHTMPTAGIAGLVKAALALHHRVLPPSLHCDDPHPGLGATRFRVVTEAEPWAEASDGTARLAAVNAFGFGGINAHVVLEEVSAGHGRADRPPAAHGAVGAASRAGGPQIAPTAVRVTTGGAPASRRVPPALLLAAATVDDLRRMLDRPDHELLLDLHAAPGVGVGSVRLAIVDPTPDRLARARKVVDRGRPWRGHGDLWFTAEPLLGPGGGAIAFCHPGVEATFDPQVDDLTDHLGLPAIEQGDGTVGERVRAIVALGRGLDRILRDFGVRPDVILGHSVGEWTGLNTAGHIPADQAAAFAASLDPTRFEVPDAYYAALGCPAATAVELIEGLAATTLSHDNCPRQAMVCGPSAEVDVVVERARERHLHAQRLPFRSGFHSLLLRDHLGPFEAGLERLPLQEPHTPLWSATTLAPYPSDPAGVRELTVRHLLEPVSFGPLVQRLHAVAGVRAVVQVGVGSTTGFVDDALRDAEVLVVAASDPKRSGVEQLTRTFAALWAEGHEPDWARLQDPSAPVTAPTAAASIPTPAPASARSNGGIPLRLGAPLLHLDAPPRLAGPRAAGPDRAALADGPLGASLVAVLDEVDRATADVLAALQRDDPTAPRRPGPIAPAPPAPVAPAIAPTTAPTTAPTDATTERTVTFSTAEMPWLLDHCFYRQREGWPDLRDRFPVAPMTAMVELLRDEAERVTSRTVVALRSVRALRWLAAEPATDVVVRTAPVTRDGAVVALKVAIDGHARAIAVLADAHPTPPVADGDGALGPLADAAPSARTAEAMYAERMMFHGPAYQGVASLDAIGPDGLDAILTSLAAPGGLLDSTGQVMGYWMMVRTDVDRLALPVAIDELAFFGPQPPVGEPLTARVRITHLDAGRVRADHDLLHDGRPWCRIRGWEDRRFQSDDLLWPLFVQPEGHLVTEAQPGGWELVRERWSDTPTRELVLRRYTVEAERADHDTHNPRDRRTWLLGRVAVKDAVRRRLMAECPGSYFPAEVAVTNDEYGAPSVTVPEGFAAPHVSLAHVDGFAVAIASDRGPVGIDLTPVDVAAEQIERLALTDRERSRLAARGPARALGLARAWAVKEAVGKARRTGLAGRPRDLEIDRVDGTRHRVGDLVVDTTTIDLDGRPHVVAWTTGATP